jgi:hypothetical protein
VPLLRVRRRRALERRRQVSWLSSCGVTTLEQRTLGSQTEHVRKCAPITGGLSCPLAWTGRQDGPHGQGPQTRTRPLSVRARHVGATASPAQPGIAAGCVPRP